MYFQSDKINSFSKSILGKIITVVAIIAITKKFGKNAGIIASLIMILNLYNAHNIIESAKSKKPKKPKKFNKIANCRNQKKDKCNSCNPGYQLRNNNCSPRPIPNCVRQSGIRCQACSSAYQVRNNKCSPKPIPNCVKQLGIRCHACRPPYSVSNNKCIIKSEPIGGLPIFKAGMAKHSIHPREHNHNFITKFVNDSIFYNSEVKKRQKEHDLFVKKQDKVEKKIKEEGLSKASQKRIDNLILKNKGKNKKE